MVTSASIQGIIIFFFLMVVRENEYCGGGLVVRCSVGRRCVSCGGVFVMVVGLCATTLFGVVVVEGNIIIVCLC